MPLPQAAKERHARALGLSAAELTAADKASKLDDKSLSAAVAHDFDLVELADFQEVAHISNARSRLEAAKARDRNDGAGTRGHWAHALQCLKDEAAEKAKRAQLKQDLAAAGIKLVDWDWRWHETPMRPLKDLVTPLGTAITADQHARCPGHAATLNPFKPTVTWLCTDWRACQHKLSPEASGSQHRTPRKWRRSDAEPSATTQSGVKPALYGRSSSRICAPGPATRPMKSGSSPSAPSPGPPPCTPSTSHATAPTSSRPS